ncbi:MAG: patatin-like phospholipase family protein [Elusimicrobia bacterium]|nr:patatin-like phospholipase family protein [Elusimicrobiota bacterium]
MNRRLLGAALGALLLFPAKTKAALDLSQDGLLRDHLWNEFLALPKNRRPVVGVALSAGSVRGLAHIGVLQALDDAGFPIDVVAGTSMGSVVGAVYASGLPARRAKDLLENADLRSIANLGTFSLLRLLLSDKLLSSKSVAMALNRYLNGERFESLPKRFACVSMDLDSGEAILFRHGNVGEAVRASMNLPGVFAPVEYRQRYLVDGGVVDYLPIDAARILGAQWILASVTEPDYTLARPKNVLQNLNQVIDIRSSLMANAQAKNANFVISPGSDGITMFQFSRVDEAVDQGIIAAHKSVDAAEENLILFALNDILPGLSGKPTAP